MRFVRFFGLAALLAAAPVLAQSAAPAPGPTRAPRLSFTEKMAKAEADLTLSSSQKPLWDAYVAERKDSYAARRGQPPLDLPAWLAAQQKQYADEAKVLEPLWASLSVQQRQIADQDLMPHRRGKKSADPMSGASATP